MFPTIYLDFQGIRARPIFRKFALPHSAVVKDGPSSITGLMALLAPFQTLF